MNIGEQLKRMRLDRQYSYGDLARLSGLSRATVQSTERNGPKGPQASTLLALAQAYGLQSIDIFFGDDVSSTIHG